MIDFCCEHVEMPSLDYDTIQKWVQQVVVTYDFQLGELCYIFCDDEYILDVNRQYLDHDYYTDIITFDYCESNIVSGDLFISLDTVRSNAKLFFQPYSQELLRVIIHGVLHLCGVNDKSEAEEQEMRDAEEEALLILNELQNES